MTALMHPAPAAVHAAPQPKAAALIRNASASTTAAKNIINFFCPPMWEQT